jgi:putative transposase
MNPKVSKGTEMLWHDNRVRVVEPEYAGKVMVHFVDDETQVIHAADAHELRALSTTMPVSTALAAVPAAQWEQASRRAAVCRQLLTSGDTGRAAVEEAAMLLGLSVRTLQRDLQTMREVDHPAALIPEPGGRPVGLSMVDPRVERIIQDAIETIYLAGNRPALHEVGEEVRATCRAQGLAPPTDRTIGRRIERLDAYAVLKARQGPKAAKYTLKPMVGHIEVALPLDCIQIDHTRADVMLCSDDEYRVLLGRPWVTLAIDVRTRQVVGVYISFDAPSATAVALCMVNVLLPKDEFLKWLNLEGQWPVYGKPKLIYVDNGKDFHSQALRRGCEAIGIDLQYRPVGSPHYGGLIERLIGTLMGRCRLLNGSTQRDVRELGDYDAEAHATMTLSEFRRWFVNEIVSQYQLRLHRALGVSPLVAWNQAVADGFTPDQLPGQWTPFEILANFLPAVTRKIRRDGIQFADLHYWHNGLAEWVGTEEPRTIYHDPRDVRFVYVRGPSGQILRAEVTRSSVPEMTLVEWQAHKAQGRKLTHDPGLIALRDAGLKLRRDIIDSTTQATAKARRARCRSDTSRAQTPPCLTADTSCATSTGVQSATSTTAPVIYDAEIWS